MTDEFAGHEPQQILERIDCHLYPHPAPNQQAAEGMSLCTTDYHSGGRVYAELHVVTPARLRPESVNFDNEPRSADHAFYRYIVHEYGSIWLGLLARDKRRAG